MDSIPTMKNQCVVHAKILVRLAIIVIYANPVHKGFYTIKYVWMNVLKAVSTMYQPINVIYAQTIASHVPLLQVIVHNVPMAFICIKIVVWLSALTNTLQMIICRLVSPVYSHV